MPLFTALLSLPVPEGRYPALELTSQQQKQQTLDGLVAWTLEAAEKQPFLLVWEDLHWADATTVEYLGLLLDQAPTASLLLALTYRPDFTPPWPTRSHMIPITLNRLERAQAEAMVRALTGDTALPAEVLDHIVAKTDGVPLFVEELTKMLLESDLLRQEGDSYELTGPLTDLAIPATLQESLLARLDRLPTVREVAQLGAVLGREFDYETLKALGAIEDEALQDGLRRLVDAELLYQRGRPPRSKYIFKHALVQDAAYQSLLRRTRQNYHKQVAELLSAQFSEILETQPEIIAHHFTEAGENEQAMFLWSKAGHLALQRSANHEAIGHLNKGLALVPEGDEHAKAELEMLRLLGTAFMATKGYAAPETVETFARARQLCNVVRDDSIFPVMFGIWLSALVQCRHANATEMCSEMLDLVEGTKDEYAVLAAHAMAAFTYLHTGDLLEAREHFNIVAKIGETLDPSENDERILAYGLDTACAAWAYGAWCEWLLGYPDAAQERYRLALSAQETSKQSYTRARALYWCSVVNQFCGDWTGVSELAQIAVENAREHGLPMVVSVSRIMNGAADATLNGAGDQRQEMVEALQAYGATGARFQSPYLRTLIAEIMLRENDIDGGLDIIADAEHMVQESGENYFLPEILRLKGELLYAKGNDEDKAESCFLKSLEVARSQSAKSLELRTVTSMARTMRDRGETAQAFELLHPVYEWFTEGFETADLKAAKTLLDELS